MVKQAYTTIVARIGHRNAEILTARASQHNAGLQLMVEPRPKTPKHKVRPMKGTIHLPPTDEEYREKYGSFLDRMKAIEEQNRMWPVGKKPRRKRKS